MAQEFATDVRHDTFAGIPPLKAVNVGLVRARKILSASTRHKSSSVCTTCTWPFPRQGRQRGTNLRHPSQWYWHSDRALYRTVFIDLRLCAWRASVIVNPKCKNPPGPRPCEAVPQGSRFSTRSTTTSHTGVPESKACENDEAS